MDGDKWTIDNKGARSAAGSSPEWIALYQGRTLEKHAQFMNVIIKKEKCRDYMSDGEFDHSVLILSGTTLLRGCCRNEIQ